MSPLLLLQVGMAQIPIKNFVVAKSKEVKANIHHEILKKHLVPWTNRSIIFTASEWLNGNVQKEILGTLLVNCILPAVWTLYMQFLNLLDVHIWCIMQDDGQAMLCISLAPLTAYKTKQWGLLLCTFTKLAALTTQNLSSRKMKDFLNNWAESNPPTYTNQTFSVLPQASIGDLNNETLAFST